MFKLLEFVIKYSVHWMFKDIKKQKIQSLDFIN